MITKPSTHTPAITSTENKEIDISYSIILEWNYADQML